MNDKLSGLYQRICDYSPDDGESAFTFTQRLARDNGWDFSYARRVVEEYKKFMFLAVAAGHPVTPSEQVDQAWHLHLIYSRSYWDDFCSQVLGTPIHHGPTKGGRDEHDKYHDWYEQTKASYPRLLGQQPPVDIWPESQTRFGDDVHCVRVNTRQHWVIPKRRARRLAVLALATLALVASTAYTTHLSGQAEPTRLVSISPMLAHATLNSHTLNHADLARQQSVQQTAIVAGSITIIAMLIAVAVVISAMCRGKCSSCGRFQAMKKTGAVQRESESSAAEKHEWKCQHCGATTWAALHASSGGCGGWFGCGGGDSSCGDSGCGGSGCGGCGGGGCGGGGCGGG